MTRPLTETLSDHAHIIVAAVALTIAGSLIAAVAYHGLNALAQWSVKHG